MNEQDYINFESACMGIGGYLGGIKGFFEGFIVGSFNGVEKGKQKGLDFANRMEKYNGEYRDALNKEWFDEHPFDPSDPDISEKYKKFEDWEKAFHLVLGCDIDKYETRKADENGGYAEIVWDNTNNCEVTSPKERGTYNRGRGINHLPDIGLWILLGTGVDDPSTMTERATDFINSIPPAIKANVMKVISNKSEIKEE